MAKFNEKKETVTNLITNYMGELAFKQTPKEELIFSVLTSFFEDSYYESKESRIDRVSNLIKEIAQRDPEFVAKLAIYVRNIFHMRSAFPILMGELSKVNKGNDIVRRGIFAGAERVDDLTELVAYVGKPVPNAVTKGVASALTKFDTYQLSHYRGEKRKVSLIDVFNLVHPKPINDTMSKTYNDLMNGKLKQSNTTWEVNISSVGQIAKEQNLNEEDKFELKKDAWEKQIDVWVNYDGQNLVVKNYMALLRNLRNILQVEVDDIHLNKVLRAIADKKAVLNSKQLPFRFLSAYAEIEKLETPYLNKTVVFESDNVSRVELVKGAIESAVLKSVDNIPKLPGKTVILSDNSGSMMGDIGGGSLVSAISKRTSADIANLFATLYWAKAENTWIGLFGDTLKTPKLNRENGIFKNFSEINKAAFTVGPATETGIFTAFEKLIEEKEKVERIIIFSDCQVGDGCKWYDTSRRKQGPHFNKLVQDYLKFSPDTKIYSVDLKGYGNKMFDKNVVLVAGWSEKIFDLIKFAETDKNALIKEIEKIQI